MKETHQNILQKIYRAIMLIVLTAFITFMITSVLIYKRVNNVSLYNNIGNNTSESENLNNIDKYLKKVKSLIDKNYLWKDKIDEKKLIDGAISGYVSGLGDKYTEYIPASEMKEFTEEITGSFVGIGVYMVADEESNKIIVYYPIPDSPADKVGIKSGDAIIKVDGIEYGYDDFNIIADHIKGESGTKVKLVIERDGEYLDFEITREKIDINLIYSKVLDNNIGYVKLPSFDSDSSKRLKEKVDDLVSKGAKSLIIDLRNNGGGIVDESIEIADYFLEKGLTILKTKNNNNGEEITLAKSKKTFEMPLIVLVNQNTASASEILTATFKDNKRAKVIGTKTYGKGVIQTVLTLSDGSGLKITTAEYFTPNGAEINKKGITPDIVEKLPDSIKSVYTVSEKEDTQLKRAIEELK